jgi:hypothetical protein
LHAAQTGFSKTRKTLDRYRSRFQVVLSFDPRQFNHGSQQRMAAILTGVTQPFECLEDPREEIFVQFGHGSSLTKSGRPGHSPATKPRRRIARDGRDAAIL